jgi:hypothetical protein
LHWTVQVSVLSWLPSSHSSSPSTMPLPHCLGLSAPVVSVSEVGSVSAVVPLDVSSADVSAWAGVVVPVSSLAGS